MEVERKRDENDSTYKTIIAEPVCRRKDLCYDFSVLSDRCDAHVHWYEMERRQGVFKVAAYYTRYNIVQFPWSSADALEASIIGETRLRTHNSVLVRYARSHRRSLFSCVVTLNITTPAVVYQLVIDNITAEMREKFCDHIRANDHGVGVTHNYYLCMKWVHDMPPDLITRCINW